MCLEFHFNNNNKDSVSEKDAGRLLSLLEEQFSGSRIIRSGSGRPCKCELQDPAKGEPDWKIKGNKIEVQLVGHGRRVKEGIAQEIDSEHED